MKALTDNEMYGGYDGSSLKIWKYTGVGSTVSHLRISDDYGGVA